VTVLPDLFVLTTFITVFTSDNELFGIDKAHLRKLMQMEFVVLHSFAFVALFAFPRVDRLIERLIQGAIVSALLFMYCAMALSEGWEGLCIFVGATFATYFGFLFNLNSSAGRQIGVRWFFGTIIYFAGVTVADLPESVNDWDQEPAMIPLGIYYFTALALLELSGIYRVPFLADPERTRNDRNCYLHVKRTIVKHRAPDKTEELESEAEKKQEEATLKS
jgi:hypothetical protein